MSTIKSPLRYPGAKKKVLKYFRDFWLVPHMEYRDVFVGGGSTFFGKPLANSNWLNDKDEEVSAFFIAMRDYPNELCELVLQTKPTVALWKEIKAKELESDLERGFRTLFLNRTSFSGILKGNPIGGINQSSKYSIDCRWNPIALCKQIRECSELLQEVEITSYDFEDVIAEPGEGVLLYLDPPYYTKGNLLYRVFMEPKEHIKLAECLRETRHLFFLTYDDCQDVRNLYKDWTYFYTNEWFYSSSNKKAREVGQELFISNFDIREFTRD